MIAPDTGEFVDQRHLRMRVLIDIRDREIRSHIAIGKRGERHRHERKLRQRRRIRELHQGNITLARAYDGRPGLDQRQG